MYHDNADLCKYNFSCRWGYFKNSSLECEECDYECNECEFTADSCKRNINCSNLSTCNSSQYCNPFNQSNCCCR